MRDLSPQETLLEGRWREVDGRVEADVVTNRIDWLLSSVLERWAEDASGWKVLWRDPRDGRFWECSYPESGQHGGGPPRLALVTEEDAARNYERKRDV